MEYVKKLHENWQVTVVDNKLVKGEPTCLAEISQWNGITVDAQIPGNFELDLMRHEKIEDPFVGDNILKLRKYETSHVFYSLKFDYEGGADENTYLVFEGIDTVAAIYLNGTKIGASENMFLSHEFAASSLKKGENELFVHIYPVVLEARKYDMAAFENGLDYNGEAQVYRKAAHTFGWDICPRIVSAGLWRPVSLVQKKERRIEDTFAYVRRLEENNLAKCTVWYRVDVGEDDLTGYSVKLEGTCKESHFSVSKSMWFVAGIMEFEIPDVQLWWPRNYGEPNQYDLTFTLYKNGEVLDTKSWKQGFRTAELIADDYVDEDGNGDFCFVINKKRVYIKGTNWVPADAFHSRSRERMPKILDLIWDIGCNGIRCWGGGVYEDHEFFDWCDSHGIVVWQDFMMACSLYPHSERMKSQLREEATAVVRKLRRHPSICLWAGDNECDQFWFDADSNPDENILTREVLPEVLRREDRTRPYLPSSPYISGKAFQAGRSLDTPEQHLWGPRDYYKGPFYHDANAVFASELGYHGCPSPESLERFLDEDKMWPPEDNDQWILHATCAEVENCRYSFRIRLMGDQITYLFNRKPDNIVDYAEMSQVTQAEAVKYFIECFRSRKWKRTGLIWWNIMDNWPQFSDAIVDYYFCKKLAYHFIKRSQENICFMMDDHTGETVLYAVNDEQQMVKAHYEVYDAYTDELVCSGEVSVDADSCKAVTAVGDESQQRFYYIKWKTEDGKEGNNHYLQGRPLFDYEWYMKCLKKIGYDCFEGFGNHDQ